MINLELITKFPGWVLDMTNHPDNYMLIMSDDMDSYLSCRFLHNALGTEIAGFYDFTSGLFVRDEVAYKSKFPVYIDVCCTNNGIRCIDNHYCTPSNPTIANPNNLMDWSDREKYFKKYNGSTLLFCFALFDGNLSKLTKDQLMTLLSVDGFYSGFFNDNGKWRYINAEWLQRLQLEPLMKELECRDKIDFKNFVNEKRLYRKICREDCSGELYFYSGSRQKPTVMERLQSRMVFNHRVFEVADHKSDFESVINILSGKHKGRFGKVFSAAPINTRSFMLSSIV